MTRINKIVMHGFKSFAKRTEIPFESNFNIILGPNGSGKSNVLDALCFVLGKTSSKSLRAEKSSNLIYNGGKAKNSSPYGEVSLYFDNSGKIFPTEDKTVKLTRVVKQNGQSIYRINDRMRTRQQIIDLMSIARIDPEGYNIILQGDIARFAEMTSLERRQIIEEIAGISVYEDKKRKAMLELAKVDEKLKEAEYILAERTNYLKELKKDRDQAMKYRELNDKIKQNKATYLNLQIEDKLKEKKKFDAQIEDSSKKIAELQEKITALKKEISDRKSEIGEINKGIEARGEKEQLKLHKSIEDLRVGIGTKKQRLGMCDNELERINARKEQLENNLKEITSKISELNEEKKRLNERLSLKQKEEKELEKKIEGFRAKHKLSSTENIEKRLEEIDRLAEEKQAEILKLREEQQNLLREKDKLEYQINSIDDRIKKVSVVEKESREKLEQLRIKKQEFKKATSELSSLLNEDSSLAVQLGSSRERLFKFREESAKLSARNVQARESIFANIAVKKILEQKNKIGGIYGAVSELASVPGKYSLALEVAAGPRINSIIVDTDLVAAKCIKFLKDNRLGTATFLPLNKIKPAVITEQNKRLAKSSGCHGFAIELISFDRKFSNAFSYVFGNTLVVDNIDVARRVGIGEIRMATLDGDLAETSGAMHGGFRQKKGSFKERELTSDITAVEKQIAELENLVRTLEKRRRENELKIDGLRQKKSALEGEIIKEEKSLHLDDLDLDISKKQKQSSAKGLSDIESSIKAVADKLSGINKSLTEIKVERQELKAKITQFKDPTVLAELNTFEQKKRECSEAMVEIKGGIKNTETQINDIYLRDKENTIKIVKSQEKEFEGFKNEIKSLKEEIGKSGKSLNEMEEQEKALYGKFKSLFNKREKLGEEIQKIEAELIRKEEQVRAFEHKSNSIAIEDARVKAGLSTLQEEFKQYQGVKLLTSKPLEEVKKDISEFEKMTDQMGSVNLKALEVYDRIEKEHKELLQKKEKLFSEKEDVIAMMGEIEIKKREKFTNTFEVIRENFKKTFSALSAKGEAHLELETPDNPFEGGIVFRVKITGNKFLDIRGLSGGEKTLTALAFIFSIQEIEPASFYIMDEVDAALDKHNSEKLAKLIKTYSKNAQYIIISHNDNVITEGETLFGVSMNEDGISKVVSLRI